MQILLKSTDRVFDAFPYEREDEFERDVVSHAERIFGSSALYVDVKRRMKGNNIVTIPDGYVIDLTDPQQPQLFVIENEIVRHDAFNHIGIQMLRFVTSFDDAAKLAIRKYLMEHLSANPETLAVLEVAAKRAGSRNVDVYLESAVYREFKGIVVIDEAKDELYHVIKSIRASISVLQFKRYRADDGSLIYTYESLYGDSEEAGVGSEPSNQAGVEERNLRRMRRAKSDTVIVPAREEGFREVFLGLNQWRSIRISAAMRDRIKYIAGYQVAPISAITHIAEVEEIRLYKDTGKYQLIFKGPAQQINPIPVREPKNAPQGPVYVKRDILLESQYLEDALTAE